MTTWQPLPSTKGLMEYNVHTIIVQMCNEKVRQLRDSCTVMRPRIAIKSSNAMQTCIYYMVWVYIYKEKLPTHLNIR